MVSPPKDIVQTRTDTPKQTFTEQTDTPKQTFTEQTDTPKQTFTEQTDTPKQMPTQSKSQPKLSASASDKKGLDPESLTRDFGLMAKTIIIDPGHGGQRPGRTWGRRDSRKRDCSQYLEKTQRSFMAKGYNVLMTRETNRFIHSRNAHKFATRHKADLFLSIMPTPAKTRKRMVSKPITWTSAVQIKPRNRLQRGKM